MFITVAGTPAGYGYFETPAVPQENIMSALKTYILSNDINKISNSIQIATMAIQVDADCKVSINERAPILVQKDIGLTFDARGVFSVQFDSAVNYNITVSY